MSDYSRVRFEVLERAHRDGPRTVAALENLLRSHEGTDAEGLTCVCNVCTGMSVYALPQSRPGVLFAAEQPPCRHEFAEYSLRAE